MKTKIAKSISLVLCLCLLFCGLAACAAPAPETEPATTAAPETEPQTTAAPETESPTTATSETEPPTTEAPETEPITTEIQADMELMASVCDGGNATVCLPPDFTLEPDEALAGTGWNLVAQGDGAMILGAREDEALFAENGIAFPDSIAGYAEFINSCNNFPDPVARDEYGMYTTSFFTDGGESYTYLALFEGEGAYWMVHFICDADLLGQYEPLFPFFASLMMLK